MSEDPDVRPEDALQVAQRALAKVNDLESELTQLRADHDEAIEKLVALELRVSEHDEERPYDAYTRDDKIGMVREHAFRKATEMGGHTALDYDAVKWEIFEGEPSASHCYDLMRWASDARGFTVREPTNGNISLAVDAAEAKRGAAFFAAKKDAAEGAE